MYKILVVDDEPTGRNHVCMILRKKCPQYEIVETAENGEEALNKIRRLRPDILITDIRMPVMDGIELVNRVKKDFPEMISVIVSGYSEFEYAKSAMQSGVCDYLLKPLAPSDIVSLMKRVETRLNSLYYEKRNQILKALCNKEDAGNQMESERYFPSAYYYAVIFRWNGLPGRFVKKHGVEIFSMEEESVYMYGRDEMEALYLIPEELLFQNTFFSFAEKLFWREQKQKRGSYVTGVVCMEKISISQLKDTAQRLYRKLDEFTVIGKNQLLQLDGGSFVLTSCKDEKKVLEKLEHAIQYKEHEQIFERLHELFEIWKEQERSQLYMESEMKYILKLMQKENPSEKKPAEIEFIFDDIFYYAADISELETGFRILVKQNLQDVKKENIDNKEQLFQSILSYLNLHMKETLMLGDVCRKFGVSQTSLSRMFRAYRETSFSNYLTQIRIEKAKRIMENNPEAYIKEVAESVGYMDQFYFSRIFRSVTGTCPREYMEQVAMKGK